MEIIDTVISNASNTLSGEIIGSGTYFIVDLDEFLKGLGIDVFANIQTVAGGSSAAAAGVFSLGACR